MIPSTRPILLQKRGAPLPSPLGAWAFDENTGTTSVDNSGHSHTMTLDAGATWTTGHTNSAVTTSGASNGIHTPWSVSVPITIMGWCKPTDVTTGSTRLLFGIFDSADGAGATQMAIWAQRGDGVGTANVLQGNIRVNGGGLTVVNAASALTVNTWTHLALTYDGTNIALYKDGTLAASGSSAGTITPGSFHMCVLGDSGHNFGVVDDVRILGSALTQSQVISFMGIPVS